MKREELKELGLTDEQVEAVMSKNGAEVAALNTQITTLKSEKAQLENDKTVLTKEKGEKEKALEDLQKNSISKDEYDKKIKEIEKNAKQEQDDYIYNDLLIKGLDDAKVIKDELTREAIIGLINKEKDKPKLSEDKKSLIGLKELTEIYKEKVPHFFETSTAGYGVKNPTPNGGKGDEDGNISMATNFAKEANKSESQENKSQFFN